MITGLPKLLGTSIAWLWSLFPFLCRGRVVHELLFCHLFTALVTTLGSETALMLSSGNHVHSLCLSALVCWTFLLYLVTCTAVFSTSEFAQEMF